MNHIKIDNSTFLIQKPIKNKEEKTSKKSNTKNNFLILFDRSGSMTNVLPSLAQDMISQIKTIEFGNYVSVGYFSGESEFEFILKGFKISEDSDYKTLENIILKNSSPIGMTKFSSILEETDKILNNLSILTPNFNLFFFSDGCPTCGSYEVELSKIRSVLKKLKPNICSSLFIGYSHYINRALMSEMAEILGGSLINSFDLGSFQNYLKSFIENSSVSSKVEIHLPKSNVKREIIFTINKDKINLHQEEDSSVHLNPSESENYLYFLQNQVPIESNEIKLNFDLTNPKSEIEEEIVKSLYSLSYVLIQKMQVDKSLDVLGLLGDRKFIDKANVALTNEEYSNLEQNILGGIRNTNKRFISGQKFNYVPKQDAFCLLDLVTLLSNDKKARFYPYHPSFNYNKITVGTKQKDDSIKFTPEENASSSLEDALIFHDTKLNLNLKCKINGTINLIGDYKKHGFSENYPTWIFRNYNLVKDSCLNVKSIPVSVSKETFNKLVENNLISESSNYNKDTVYSLDLTAIPIMNRAGNSTSAKELCEKAFEELKLEGKIKALKYLKSEIEDSGIKLKTTSLTDSQEEFLKNNFVTKSGFSPKVEKVESNDHYIAKEFKIKIKNFSALPSVSDMLASKKTLTASQSLVNEGIVLANKNMANIKDEKSKLAILDNLINDLKSELFKIRTEIQKTKFSILLGRKWFTDLKSRTDTELDVGSNHYSIEISEVKVPY